MDIFVDKHSRLQFCAKTDTLLAIDIPKTGVPDYFLIKWCEQYLSREGTFVDVGAHIGSFAAILSKVCNNVQAFEPQKCLIDCLTITTCVNNFYNIEIHQVALGEQEKPAKLYHFSKDGWNSSTSEEYSKYLPSIAIETVEMKTLDSFNLKNVEFLKINAPGYEYEVL